MNLTYQKQCIEAPPFAGPLYLQVAEHMRGRVKSGEWTTNQSLPNEGDLAAHYRVSLGTMRKALEHLVRQKLVVRLQGRGTFVMKSRSETSRSLWFLRQEAALWPSAALEPTIQFVSSETSAATPGDSSLLAIGTGSIVERCSFIARHGDMAKSLDTIIFPESSTPSEMSKGDAKQILTILAGLIGSAIEYHDQIEPALANAKVSGILDIPRGTPLLSIDRQAFDEAGSIPIILRRLMFVQKQVTYSGGGATA